MKDQAGFREVWMDGMCETEVRYRKEYGGTQQAD